MLQVSCEDDDGSGVLPFGELSWGMCKEKTISLQNHGLATVPLRLAIVSVSSFSYIKNCLNRYYSLFVLLLFWGRHILLIITVQYDKIIRIMPLFAHWNSFSSLNR